MTKLKNVGLVLAATCAMSATLGQGAMAHELVWATTIYLTGEEVGEHVFTVGKLEWSCPEATFQGTAEGIGVSADNFKVMPKYAGNCEERSSSLETQVANTGCIYSLGTDTAEDVTEQMSASISIDCNHEGEIKLLDKNELCVLDFNDTHSGQESTVNQGLKGVTYQGDSSSVVVEFNIDNLTYESTGAFCELLGMKPGTYSDGVYTGAMTMTGYNDDEHTGSVAIGVG